MFYGIFAYFSAKQGISAASADVFAEFSPKNQAESKLMSIFAETVEESGP